MAKKMTAKALREALHDARIINEYQLAGHGNVFITYQPQELGRAYRSACWRVVRPGFVTDPDAHWQDHKTKVFIVYGRQDMPVKLEEAQRWAEERYGITDWVKTPFGSYMSKKVYEARMVELLGESNV